MLQQSFCQNCNAELWEVPGAPRLPCPACWGLGRNATEVCVDAVGFHESYRLKHKRPGVKRALAEERNELSYFVRDGEWHRRQILVDRQNDIYREHIVRLKTGEVVVNKEEKLSEHLGHGDAKKR
ncbi:hypothetical protein [Dokdonella immobilis]|uniref:Uncharacterized protein n=1 Tax=Dokdonella immobilis TaxID=578942 RepID=A0A1I4ZPA4_9GAMM|nr:hypothetical protein [Dokdonella immobilis]SFN52028.1 hypothetical protein SAMN05216289_12755 [Dokdonella immobilis]